VHYREFRLSSPITSPRRISSRSSGSCCATRLQLDVVLYTDKVESQPIQVREVVFTTRTISTHNQPHPAEAHPLRGRLRQRLPELALVSPRRLPGSGGGRPPPGPHLGEVQGRVRRSPTDGRVHHLYGNRARDDVGDRRHQRQASPNVPSLQNVDLSGRTLTP
jgi:hypothetical protein